MSLAPKVAAKPAAASRPPLAVPSARPAAGRADLPPTAGFSMLVDGHFKSAFDTLKQAKEAASELLARFPMLRVEVYDAVKKKRLPA